MFRLSYFRLFLITFACCFSGNIHAGEEPVVMGKLMGQLGNQLFQIAAATSVALDHGATPVFPDLKMLQRENIPLNYQHVFSHLNTSLPEHIVFEYKEPHFHFSPIPYHPNMSLFGWFQSEKYFKHHKEEILKLFAPSQNISDYLTQKYPSVLSHPKSVSIHIRMYKDTRPEYHPFVGWKYILTAMDYFGSDALFVVFSDQIQYCKKKMKKLEGKYNIVFIEGNYHFQDLYLMSLCKHHVISNSSFSWWGAYLNPHPDKIVIAPSPARWFGPAMSRCNTQDLVPEEWIILR